MDNHESYVSFETAKLLKEAGFNWTCDKNYMGEVGYPLWTATTPGNLNDESEVHKGWKSAPSLAIAQRWLREVKKIDVYIFPTTNTKRECVYQVGIQTFGSTLWIPGQPSTAQYNTYEQALESGIQRSLTIILNRNESK